MTNPSVNEQFCGACRYWRNGRCRRHAPQASSSLGVAIWPLTELTDWCGEWVARDAHD